MDDKTFESIVQKLADLDVQYLNLHREWRKEKALRERYEQGLGKITHSLYPLSIDDAVDIAIQTLQGE
jgi:hypothetical protein